jgi:hypothetical protein
MDGSFSLSHSVSQETIFGQEKQRLILCFDGFILITGRNSSFQTLPV